ncbi:MAG: hypothetical protein ABI036_05970 [Fibrobacteria bacterium]
MDISSLSSSQSATTAANSASVTATSLSQYKAEQGSQLLALLPTPASSPGLGLNLDIYSAISSQAHGLLSGGRTALQIANISLGIDMKAADPATGTDSGGQADGVADGGASGKDGENAGAGSATTGTRGNAALDAILKADGFVVPKADPYVVQTDFFRSGVGGNLNSLG